MASNVEWSLEQERKRGHECIFVEGHNSYVAKWGSYDSTGKIISENTENWFDVCWLDFSKIPDHSELSGEMKDYNYMGNLGESYSMMMHVLPPSYRIKSRTVRFKTI